MTLDQLRALCDAASPGPWEHDDKFTVSIERGDEMTAFRTYREDAAFIAAARTALPLLLTVAEAAKEFSDCYAPIQTSESPTEITIGGGCGECAGCALASALSALSALESAP